MKTPLLLAPLASCLLLLASCGIEDCVLDVQDIEDTCNEGCIEERRTCDQTCGADLTCLDDCTDVANVCEADCATFAQEEARDCAPGGDE